MSGPVVAPGGLELLGVPQTRTAAFTINTPSAVPATLRSDVIGSHLELRDNSNALVVRLGNQGNSGTTPTIAGSAVFHGANGIGPNGAVLGIGVDTSLSPLGSHAYIGKVKSDNTFDDLIFLYMNGLNPAQVEIFASGSSYTPTAGFTVNGQARAAGDPVIHAIRPTIDQVKNAFEILRLDNVTAHAPEAFPTFRIHGDPTTGMALGSGAAAPDTKLVRTVTTGGWRAQLATAGTSPVLRVENSRTPKADNDIAQLIFSSDGFDVASIEGVYRSTPNGEIVIKVKSSGSLVERMRADANGIGYFAKAAQGQTVGTSVAAAAAPATAATQTTPWGFATQAQADALVTGYNNLRAEVRALGYLT